MDPQDYFCQVSSLGSQFPKKVIQITKRAKGSKLGFWLRKGNFWFFWPRKWSIGLWHDLKSPIASFWSNGMAQNIASPMDWQMKFSVNWSKVNCVLKSQTLTFWSKSNAKDHNSSKHVKLWNFFIKKHFHDEQKFKSMLGCTIFALQDSNLLGTP